MKKLTIILFLSLSSIFIYATTYYISGSALGDDSNNGTSPSTPWKTITKLNNSQNNLQPGDSVLFERGYIYGGQQISITKSGTAQNPIYYGAYGSGSMPVISDPRIIPNIGWVQYQGNIYEKSNVNINPMSDVQAPNLFFNGQLLTPARYPNRQMNNEVYLTADEVYGIAYNPPHTYEHTWGIKDESLKSIFTNAEDLEGAYITTFSPYHVHSRKINTYNPNTGVFYFDTLSGSGPGSGSYLMSRKTYFLSRNLSMIDIPGEWYYDDTNKKLYIWFPDNVPPISNDVIEASYGHYGFRFSNYINHIIIEGFEFRHQQIASIRLSRNTGIEIKNNKFYESKNGVWGIGGTDSDPTPLTNVVIENNEFINIHREAIKSNNYNFSNPRVDNITIRENTFVNIGRHNGLMQTSKTTWHDDGSLSYGIGIGLLATNSLIELNSLDSTGREAITAGGTGTIVRNNVINYPCMNYNDCGGIMPLGNSIVDANIIKNSFGYYFIDRAIGGRGIYPDFRSGDVITNNTIVNTVTGIGLTHGTNATIKNNTVYNSLRTSFFMRRAITVPLNNIIKNNVFFQIPSQEQTPLHDNIKLFDSWVLYEKSMVHWDNNVSGIDNSSVFDSNYYWNPYSFYPTVRHRDDGSSWREKWYDLGQWKATGKDLNSKKEFIFLNEPYSINNTIGSDLIQNGNFNSGTTNWNNTGNMDFSTITGQLDGPCADINYKGDYTGTISQNINQSFIKDNYYLISFSLKGTTATDGDRFEVYLVETSNNNNIHFHRVFKNSTIRQDLWSIFKAHENANLTIQFRTPKGRYYLDNVSIYQVNVDYQNPEEKFPIFINETTEIQVINFPENCYLDLDSNMVTSITLQPFSSQILISLNDSCSPITDENSIYKPTQTKNNIIVYPNPANNYISIIFKEHINNANVEIINIQGQTIKKLNLKDTENRIDVRSLSKGIYILKIQTEKDFEIKKFIKK